MKKYFYILVVFGLLLFNLFSCQEEKEDVAPLSKERVDFIIDSIGNSAIIACFYENNGLSIIKFENEENKRLRKLVYRSGYAIFSDSLVYLKPNEFRSPRLNTNYLIKDSTVISIKQAKIIHPSSNWQGQTPWQQPYVSIYTRLDLRP